MKVFSTDLKRMLSSMGFWIAILGMFFVTFFTAFRFIKTAELHNFNNIYGDVSANAAFAALGSSVFLLIFPIMCSLPYSHAFTDDLTSRFILFYLPRAGRNPYLLSRMGVTALAGGVSVVSGFLLAVLTCTLLYPPSGITASQLHVSDSVMVTFSHLMHRVPLIFINACLWSLFSAICAAATMSRYLAYAGHSYFIMCSKLFKTAILLSI